MRGIDSGCLILTFFIPSLSPIGKDFRELVRIAGTVKIADPATALPESET
jgi:hypothetical protein